MLRSIRSIFVLALVVCAIGASCAPAPACREHGVKVVVDDAAAPAVVVTDATDPTDQPVPELRFESGPQTAFITPPGLSLALGLCGILWVFAFRALVKTGAPIWLVGASLIGFCASLGFLWSIIQAVGRSVFR